MQSELLKLVLSDAAISAALLSLCSPPFLPQSNFLRFLIPDANIYLVKLTKSVLDIVISLTQVIPSPRSLSPALGIPGFYMILGLTDEHIRHFDALKRDPCVTYARFLL